MSNTLKGAAAAASLAAAMIVPQPDAAFAAETNYINLPVHEYVMPDVAVQPKGIFASKVGQIILPTLVEPKLELPPRGFPPAPLEIIIDRVVERMPVEPVTPPEPTTEQFQKFKLQEIDRIVAGIDVYIHGVAPELTQQAFRYLLTNGMSLAGASALWGAVIQESQGRTYAISSDGYYRGLFQWGPGRYYGVGASPYDTLEEQLGKGLWEMKYRYPRVYAVLTSNESGIEYCILAMHWFEGESVPGGRAGFSRQLNRSVNDMYAGQNFVFYQPGGGNELL